MYRSNDAGATWSSAGLDNAKFIPSLIVDPRNPDHVIAGVNSLGLSLLWRPLAKTAYTYDRGVYQTTDGGHTWSKVLSKDDTIGVVDLCADPDNPDMLYAVLYHPASGNGAAAIAATSDLYRSSDGGSTWVRALWRRASREGAGAHRHLGGEDRRPKRNGRGCAPPRRKGTH